MTLLQLGLGDQLNKLWDYSNPIETEKKFTELLLNTNFKDFEKSEIFTQIARCQGLQTEFQKAEETLCKTQNLFTDSDEFNCAKVRFLLEKGRILRSSKLPKESLKYFLEAYETSLNFPELSYFTVDALHMLGLAENETEKKVYWNLEAIKVAEGSSDVATKNWLGSIYNNLGWIYHDEIKFEQALRYFQSAYLFFLDLIKVDVNEDAKLKSKLKIAKWTVGRCLRSLNKIDEALEIQLSLNDGTDGYVNEELSYLYDLKGNIELRSVNAKMTLNCLTEEDLGEERYKKILSFT
ncbi:hypothetical protein HDU92_007795 [Lobulomyces angularis]|nr:hypothetical protein HDU92_007795 [Lobulomyces angularis]